MHCYTTDRDPLLRKRPHLNALPAYGHHFRVNLTCLPWMGWAVVCLSAVQQTLNKRTHHMPSNKQPSPLSNFQTGCTLNRHITLKKLTARRWSKVSATLQSRLTTNTNSRHTWTRTHLTNGTDRGVACIPHPPLSSA